MKTTYQENKKKLAEKMLNEPAKTPMQEVKPVQPLKEKASEVHVNFWLEEALMEQVKMYSLKNKMTIKQVAKEAFKVFLENSH
jgi:flavoprotein